MPAPCRSGRFFKLRKSSHTIVLLIVCRRKSGTPGLHYVGYSSVRVMVGLASPPLESTAVPVHE